MSRDFAASLEAFRRAMSAYWEGVYSQGLRAIVQYYAEHPEELDALVAAREKGYQEDSCHCFCQWRRHGGCTTGAADTTRPFSGSRIRWHQKEADAVPDWIVALLREQGFNVSERNLSVSRAGHRYPSTSWG